MYMQKMILDNKFEKKTNTILPRSKEILNHTGWWSITGLFPLIPSWVRESLHIRSSKVFIRNETRHFYFLCIKHWFCSTIWPTSNSWQLLNSRKTWPIHLGITRQLFFIKLYPGSSHILDQYILQNTLTYVLLGFLSEECLQSQIMLQSPHHQSQIKIQLFNVNWY